MLHGVIINIQLAGYTLYRQDRTAASGKTHYLPREFSSAFFIAAYIPPQIEAGTKTALNELYSPIGKQENSYAGKLISGFTKFLSAC